MRGGLGATAPRRGTLPRNASKRGIDSALWALLGCERLLRDLLSRALCLSLSCSGFSSFLFSFSYRFCFLSFCFLSFRACLFGSIRAACLGASCLLPVRLRRFASWFCSSVSPTPRACARCLRPRRLAHCLAQFGAAKSMQPAASEARGGLVAPAMLNRAPSNEKLSNSSLRPAPLAPDLSGLGDDQ